MGQMPASERFHGAKGVSQRWPRTQVVMELHFHLSIYQFIYSTSIYLVNKSDQSLGPIREWDADKEGLQFSIAGAKIWGIPGYG